MPIVLFSRTDGIRIIEYRIGLLALAVRSTYFLFLFHSIEVFNEDRPAPRSTPPFYPRAPTPDPESRLKEEYYSSRLRSLPGEELIVDGGYGEGEGNKKFEYRFHFSPLGSSSSSTQE